MFDFLRLKGALNKHDKKSASAINKAVQAANALSKVNNELITMDADVKKKAEILSNVSDHVNEKIASNKAVIAALKLIHSK